MYRQWVPCNYSFSPIIFVNLVNGPDLAPNCLIVGPKDCFDFFSNYFCKCVDDKKHAKLPCMQRVKHYNKLAYGLF